MTLKESKLSTLGKNRDSRGTSPGPQASVVVTVP